MKCRSQRRPAVRIAAGITFVVTAAFRFSGPCFASSPVHMPAGAYLARPASSATDLAGQVKAITLVAQRYARIFHMSPQMVRSGFSKLRLARLPSERTCRVYYVHKGERLGFKIRRIPKGTSVFSLANGTPVLIQVCGNPLSNSLPAAIDARHPTQIPLFNPDEPLKNFQQNTASVEWLAGSAPRASQAVSAASTYEWVEDPDAASPESIPADPKYTSVYDPATIAGDRLARFASGPHPSSTIGPTMPGSGAPVPSPEPNLDLDGWVLPPVDLFPSGGSGGNGGGTTLTSGDPADPSDPGDFGIDTMPAPFVTPEGSSLALLGVGALPILYLLRPKSRHSPRR